MRSGEGEKNRARNLAPPERNPEYAPAWCSCIKTPKPPLTNTDSKEIFNFDEKLEKNQKLRVDTLVLHAETCNCSHKIHVKALRNTAIQARIL